MTHAPTAALVIIGNEILSGRTQDANLAFLARQLNEAGIRLWHVRVIPDVEEIIAATVAECSALYDYVFTTGGIGPTHDDITALAIAKAFGVALHRDPHAVALLEAHYDKGKLNEARLKMADVPEGASLILNPVSAAPGFQIGNVFVMAGVPKIVQAMWDDLRPRLSGGAPMLSKSLTCNLPEGRFAEALGTLQKRFPSVEIGSYPHFGQDGVSTSLVCRCTDADAVAEAAEAVAFLVEELGGARLADYKP